jgi:hypothetical protein
MVCFLGAAGGGVWLVVDILLSDRRSRDRAERHTRAPGR